MLVMGRKNGIGVVLRINLTLNETRANQIKKHGRSAAVHFKKPLGVFLSIQWVYSNENSQRKDVLLFADNDISVTIHFSSITATIDILMDNGRPLHHDIRIVVDF